jgi:hypothetical protein
MIWQGSFSCFGDPTTFRDSSWYFAPLGVCYHVWSEVGGDAINTPLGQGWVNDNGNAGSRGRMSIPIQTERTTQSHFSTIYIPFIKQNGTNFPSGSSYTVRWHNGSTYRDQGYLSLSDYPHTQTYPEYPYPISSAMVMPVIVYSSVPRTVEIELIRTYSGTPVWVGRPIVMDGVACSWFLHQ